MSIVTLLTDFGLKDGNVGVMKGVIWSVAPDVHIADISHTISPQDIREASLVLSRSAPFFPPGSIHVVVIDPGVGTDRRPIGARLGSQYFVGPDNGVITMLLEQVEQSGSVVEVAHLDRPEYWLPEISNVFHGRDIFAPVAGHMAAGIPLTGLGTLITDPERLVIPKPKRTIHGWRGEVIHVDHFGNISSNIRFENLGKPDQMTVRVSGARVWGLMRTFGDRPPGDLIAMYGSTGNLLICQVNGNAAKLLGTKIGDLVEVELT